MRCIRLLLGFIAFAAVHASAQIFTWTGATDDNRSTATNWASGTVPPSARHRADPDAVGMDARPDGGPDAAARGRLYACAAI